MSQLIADTLNERASKLEKIADDLKYEALFLRKMADVYKDKETGNDDTQAARVP